MFITYASKPRRLEDILMQHLRPAYQERTRSKSAKRFLGSGANIVFGSRKEGAQGFDGTPVSQFAQRPCRCAPHVRVIMCQNRK